jgi:hypothetical protein
MLLSILIFSVKAIGAKVDNELPPILDYYPGCDFSIIDVLKVNENTDTPDDEEIVSNILNKLRKRAKKYNADAVVLIRVHTKQVISEHRSLSGALNYTYQLNYEAEILKGCINEDPSNRVQARYNHKGLRIIGSTNTSSMNQQLKLVISSNKQSLRPKITSHNISISDGLYGMQLGSSFEQVIKAFGIPSTHFVFQNNDLIISYGRKHWLSFQNNRLVKIQSDSNVFSQNIVNQIPFINDFDDYSWKINNKVGYKEKLTSVREALNISKPLSKKGNLKLENQSGSMILDFVSYKNDETNSKEYSLRGFTIQSSDYEEPAFIPHKRHYHFSIINKVFSDLQLNKSINLEELKIELGEPIGKIILSTGSSLEIYNNNLVLKIENAQLSYIQMNEQALNNASHQSKNATQWSLGSFQQGNSLEQASSFFPNDIFELNGAIEIEKENYTLLLHFDGNEENYPLYEAIITLN